MSFSIQPRLWFWILAVLILAAARPASAVVRYVDAAATGANNGTSWVDAFTDLQSALTVAVANDEIWVAAGVYKPTAGPIRTISFLLVDGVGLYGGFNGAETVRSQRDWMTNLTRLSGRIGSPEDGDNSYHVVQADGVGASTVLDGFTIDGGRSNVPNTGSPLTDKRGGGMVILDASPAIANCVFDDNLAYMLGGAVYNENGSPTFDNVTFSNNVVAAKTGTTTFYGRGAAVESNGGFISFSNILFIDNDYALGSGREVVRTRSPSVFVNCRFEDNGAGGIEARSAGSISLSHCDFVNCDGRGLFTGSGTQATVEDCSFVGNSNSGAYISNGTVTNARFDGNTAQYGAALTVYGTVTIRNAVIMNHNAGSGGVVAAGANTIFVNSTFFGNLSSTGADVFDVGSGDAVEVYNSVVWGNGDTPVVLDDGTITFHNSLVEGSGGSGGWDPSFGTDGGDNIDTDPRFIDSSAGDLHLGGSSVAIDGGDNSAPSLPPTDLDGAPRIIGGTVDMGAYEFACPGGTRLYVDASATGDGTGVSWVNACTSLSTAIAVVCGSINEIWVAAGTYTPTASGDRKRSFGLQSSLAIYGGFAGNETLLAERDPGWNPTTLSGDIGAAGAADNAYHVVTASNVDSTAVLDGFVVRDGNADGPSPDDSGAGLFCSDSANPTLRNLVVVSNSALARGGGMYNTQSAPTVNSSIFRQNSVGGSGGGAYSFLGRPTFVNVVFFANAAVSGGGGMHNVASDAVLTNVTFHANSAVTNGGAMYNNAGDVSLYNSILWENGGQGLFNLTGSPFVSHSLVQGSGGSANWNPLFGTDGGGNIDMDPLLLDGPNGDVRLTESSPAIDAGDNGAPNLAPTDLAGNPRIIGGTVDMGAFEFVLLTAVGDGVATYRTAIRSVYPNPFNPTVTVAFELERSQDVHVTIYDVRGRVVRRLLRAPLAAGPQSVVWDGHDDAGTVAATGVYIIKLQAGTHVERRKITLLK